MGLEPTRPKAPVPKTGVSTIPPLSEIFNEHNWIWTNDTKLFSKLLLNFLFRNHFYAFALPDWAICSSNWASERNRTVILCLEGRRTNRCATLANILLFSMRLTEGTKVKTCGIFRSRVWPTQPRGLCRTQTCDPLQYRVYNPIMKNSINWTNSPITLPTPQESMMLPHHEPLPS